MDRRGFIKVSGTAAAGLAISSCVPRTSELKKKGHFSLTQISSATDTIGESYLMKTSGGKVIMVDGGYASDAENLRTHLMDAGGHVDLWFITHPHEDHMEALATILGDPKGITVDKVIYSRVQDSFLDCEPQSGDNARRYYRVLDECMDGTDFLNIHTVTPRFIIKKLLNILSKQDIIFL